MKTISILKATHLSGYKIKLLFNDNSERVIDFENFLANNSHPQYNKYKKPSMFKKFKIEMGNIVWGKDWDLVFPVYNLFKGKV